MVSFTVPGVPVAEGRARATRFGGGVRLYTPTKTRSHKDAVKALALKAMGGAGPLEGPLKAHVLCVMPIPASWSKARREEALAGRGRPTAKPDCDNLAKAVLDGCNGVVFHDDAQVVQLEVWKLYGDQPRTEVQIWEA